ncbi:MAG: DNA primase [Dehalococcoidia bacterium]|nr:DNA primase [Dehalococcoidia bacterium]
MDAIEEIKQKTDIGILIGQYTQLTKSGKTMRGLCPFHAEKHGSFFVYPDQQRWHCFGACAGGGDIFSFMMKKEGLSFGEAVKLLAEKSGVTLPEHTSNKIKQEKNSRLHQANQMAAEYYHQLLLTSTEASYARTYLEKRGLTASSLESFNLGYSPNSWDSLTQYLLERGFTEDELLSAGLIIESDGKTMHDRFRNRLMFPIADTRGHIVGFGGRTLDNGAQPKYLNSPQTVLFDKSSTLYGLYQAKDAIRKEDCAIIVEGYMDVIVPHQYNFKNVVASMGTAIGENHIALLKKTTTNLILALDPDSAGENATLRSVWLENSLGAEIRVALLPQGQDPDEIVRAKPDYWKQLIEEAIPAIDFTFEKSLVGIDLSSASGKSQAVDKLMPLISQIKDRVRQTFYLDKLAAMVEQSPKKLELLLIKEARPQIAIPALSKALRPAMASPLEEYFLSIMLQYPELSTQKMEILPEYFTHSENRELYNAIISSNDHSQIKPSLDSALWDYYERLMGQSILPDRLSDKLAETVLRIREEYLKRLAQNRSDELAVTEGNQLREVFAQKGHLNEQKRRQK